MLRSQFPQVSSLPMPSVLQLILEFWLNYLFAYAFTSGIKPSPLSMLCLPHLHLYCQNICFYILRLVKALSQ